MASARRPCVVASRVPWCSSTRSRALSMASSPACGRGPDGELERIVAEAHAHFDAWGVVERCEQVLDDPVRGQLDAGRQNVGTALDGQPRVVALGAFQQRLEVGQGRLRLRWEIGAVVAQYTQNRAHLLKRASALALDLDEGGGAVAGSVGRAPSSAIPASSPRRRWRSSSSSPERRARSVATSSRVRLSRASRNSEVRTSSSSVNCRRERTTRPMPQNAGARGMRTTASPP